MKGDPKVIDVLNSLLAEELTAVNQYMVHSEMCDDWGYEKLHKSIEKRAIDEMKHAEMHIARILFLEGRPVVSEYKKIYIGQDVPQMYENDRLSEKEAIEKYNTAIKLCVEAADNGTKEMLESILKDEEAHIDYIESQQDKIAQMGLAMYLTTLTKKA